MATRTVVTKHKWRIDNFKQRLSGVRNGNPISSDIFSLNGKSEAKFSMKLQRYDYDKDIESNALYLACKDLGRNHELKLNAKSWRESSGGEVEHEIEWKLVLEKAGDTKLLNWHDSGAMLEFATDDIQFLCYEIQHEEPINEAVKRGPEAAEQELAYRKKVGQIMIELHSIEHSDSTTHFQVEDEEFKANKFTLMAHSDYFQRMFSCPLSTESQTGLIKIEDAEPKVIEALIRWMYQAEIANMDEVATGLYRATDRYEIDVLKCMKAMIKSLSIENLPPRLILAYIYSEEQLKQHVLTLLHEDKKNLHSFMASDEWSEFSFSDPEMRKKVLADIYT